MKLFKTIAEWLHAQTVHERRDNDDHIIEAYGRIPHEVLDHLFVTVYSTVYLGTDPNACMIHNGKRIQVEEIFDNVRLAQAQKVKPAPEQEAEIYDPRFA